MGRLQSIETALVGINDTKFQELCDVFLKSTIKTYSSFFRTGTQLEKQKSVKGTPDSYFLLPDGQYIFIEYSTNISSGVTKLKEDIVKCLDESKTGISVDKISEILLCFNFRLKADETKELNKLFEGTKIKFTLIPIDELSTELHLNHRNLAHEYLDIPLDTGQIVSIDQFVAEYDKAANGLATPLSNEFFHREDEIEELSSAIENNEIIILTGAAGVGKTKLAIETINQFTALNSDYSSYCVSYKSHDLLDDLHQYFDKEKDYILFVDDANRIDQFGQIIGFYKATRNGNLKIVLTVRNYAYENLKIVLYGFEPKTIHLMKFTDEQIIDIIKSDEFKINHPDYQKEIVRVADGNPRIAIMASKLANEKKNLNFLSDASNLFEEYFTTFIHDDNTLSDKHTIKVLGIISFFHPINISDKEICNSILLNFDIAFDVFIDRLDKLEKLELIEIQHNHAKIPEQNLATFFFYKAFIKDDLLSFKTLMQEYFENHYTRFKDTIIPANNIFGFENVMQKVKPTLKRYYDTVETHHEKSLTLLTLFWFYLQDETLLFIYNSFKDNHTPINPSYETTYEENDFAYNQDYIIELLGYLFKLQDKLDDALELSLVYVMKKPEKLGELLHKFREELTFKNIDHQYRYTRQNILINFLIKKLNEDDELGIIIFYEISTTLLKYKFQSFESGRGMTFSIVTLPLQLTPSIKEIRSNIWNDIDKNYQNHPDKSLKTLLNYTATSPDVIKEIMEYDLPFIIKIIETHLTSKSFENCCYVQQQIRWCKRNNVNHSSFETLKIEFTNPTYQTYEIIYWDRLRDKESFEFRNYDEYKSLKEEEIRGSFKFSIKTEVEEFFKQFELIKKLKASHSFTNSLDIIIDENFKNDVEIGIYLLQQITSTGNWIKITPVLLFTNHINSTEKAHLIWTVIDKNIFDYKTEWAMRYFENLDESLLNFQSEGIPSINKLLEELTVSDSWTSINLNKLDKYYTTYPNLVNDILSIVISKYKEGKSNLSIWFESIHNHINEPYVELNLVKSLYLLEALNTHSDYQGRLLIDILKKDASFLLELVKCYNKGKKQGFRSADKQFKVIWEIEGIEETLIEVIDYISDNDIYFGMGSHFCNEFFVGVDSIWFDRIDEFLLNYIGLNNSDKNRMNIIFDVIRHSRRELFDKAILHYLTFNHSLESFREIKWRGNGGSMASADVYFGDLEAADWQNIFSIVQKSDIGIELIPIKQYLQNNISRNIEQAKEERKRNFIGIS